MRNRARNLRQRITRRTRVFGGLGHFDPAGTDSLGSPLFYLRVGNGRDGLVHFEVGGARRFFYVGRFER